MLRGGYPIAVELAPEQRSRWFANLRTLLAFSRLSGVKDVLITPLSLLNAELR